MISQNIFLKREFLFLAYFTVKILLFYLLTDLILQKILYSGSVTIADMRDTIRMKKIKLHMLVENMKLSCILSGQVCQFSL